MPLPEIILDGLNVAPEWELDANGFVKNAALSPFSKSSDRIKPTVSSIFGSLCGPHQKIELLKKIESFVEADVKILSDSYVGVEIEVENIQERPHFAGLFENKEDGSLRNNGVEYVTYPTPANYIPALLTHFFNILKEKNVPDFSKRTSIHVHVNATDMTIEQVKTFVLLYLSIEGLLFKFAGEHRSKSVFCVPLLHAGYLKRLSSFFSEVKEAYFKENVRQWHKYTALNIAPLRGLGTIEFRHMVGTDDVTKLSKWVKIIVAIKKAAQSYSLEEIFKYISSLNTTSEYENYLNRILEESAEEFSKYNLQEEMEKQVTYIKTCFIPQQEYKVIPEKFESSSMCINSRLTKFVFDFSINLNLLSLTELEELLYKVSERYHASEDPKKAEEYEKYYRKVQVAFFTKQKELAATKTANQINF